MEVCWRGRGAECSPHSLKGSPGAHLDPPPDPLEQQTPQQLSRLAKQVKPLTHFFTTNNHSSSHIYSPHEAPS